MLKATICLRRCSISLINKMDGKRRKVFVAGVGMTKFEKPKVKDWDYPDMGKEAGLAALKDAGIPYEKVEAVVCSYNYGDPTSGQRALYEIGLSGVPVFNVNNNCSAGSSGLMMARQLIKAGHDCVMALGFEKMEGGLSETFKDRTSPVQRHMDHMVSLGAEPGLIGPGYNAMTSDVIKLFAYAAREYMEKYPGAMTFEDLVKVAYKNRKHGANNPKASLQKPTSMKSIANKDRIMIYPITIGMTAMTADGGAAAIVCSENFIQENKLENRAIEIIAQHMVTDLPSSFHKSMMDTAGYSMSKLAAEKVYKDSGLQAKDVDVIEVHDCFSCNEVFMYEAMQLVKEGEGVKLFNTAKWVNNKAGGEVCQLGGRWVVNPSGGIESKGHPIGATGLGQCAELVSQLRGEAEKRQVEGAKVALQHNYGIGGAAVVTMYQRPTFNTARL
ncbi:unnamed protein product [Owenia fusiformis]|uniref:Non-specific lipid-transfer protein n=1 Tax=Owenia fusiformis TaxID=6347 RepID=A0A8J1UUM7_OWEFU|nr:unnamed protein product [Owenia fusiformis]